MICGSKADVAGLASDQLIEFFLFNITGLTMHQCSEIFHIKARFAKLKTKEMLFFSEHRTIEDSSRAINDALFLTERKLLSRGIQRLLIH